MRAGLLANFEKPPLREDGQHGLDWCRTSAFGIDIALLPLADQFNFLKPYAVPGGVALILAGLLLCLVPIWKRIQARREAKPRSPAPRPRRSGRRRGFDGGPANGRIGGSRPLALVPAKVPSLSRPVSSSGLMTSCWHPFALRLMRPHEALASLRGRRQAAS